MSSTLPILLAQCKAYQSLEEITLAIENLIKIESSAHFNIHVSLPYSFIEPLSQKFSEQNIQMGMENLLDADEGSFTASILDKMTDHVKAKFVLIGTSQDRFSHSQNTHHLKNKVKAALSSQVKPFICIGENLQEHHDKLSKEILISQLKDCLEGLSTEELNNLYIVYNAEWISNTPWEAESSGLKEAYKIFEGVVKETVPDYTFSPSQLIITIPVYSEDVSKLIASLQTSQTFAGYSIGILGLSSELLQPLRD